MTTLVFSKNHATINDEWNNISNQIQFNKREKKLIYEVLLEKKDKYNCIPEFLPFEKIFIGNNRKRIVVIGETFFKEEKWGLARDAFALLVESNTYASWIEKKWPIEVKKRGFKIPKSNQTYYFAYKSALAEQIIDIIDDAKEAEWKKAIIEYEALVMHGDISYKKGSPKLTKKYYWCKFNATAFGWLQYFLRDRFMINNLLSWKISIAITLLIVVIGIIAVSII